ncbi:MFS transporter [Priestia endophytica]|uniref:MFS transporter n=1 Tax=Priestia endophytica TaxID=135735 RepID=UPI000DCA8872|nr:MFS transporter [Priestia endophytica]KAB2493576.1 MFS transporter [Priestia endophytica]RAS82990.1 MFS transporter [Priestia endophytica]
MNDRKITVMLGLLPFIMVLGNSSLIPILPEIQQNLNLNDTQTSFILSAFSLPAALAIPFVGILSDRYGRRKLIVLSLMLVILGSLIAGVSEIVGSQYSYSLLTVGRIIQGVGAAGTTPLAMALAGDLFSGDRRAKVLGILEVYNGIGKVIAPIIGAVIALIAWYALFFLFPLVAIIPLIGVTRYVKEEKQKSTVSFSTYIKKLGKVLKREQRWLYPMFFLGGLCLFLLFGSLYYLSFLIEEKYGIDGFFKGTSFAIPLGAMTITSYWTGKRIKEDKVLMGKLIIVGITFLISMFFVMVLFHSLSVLMFCLTIALGGLGFLLPCINMLVTSSVRDEERGFIVSIYGMVRFIGVALGPIIFEVWMSDVETMFYYAFMLIVMASLWVMLRTRIRLPFLRQKVIR